MVKMVENLSIYYIDLVHNTLQNTISNKKFFGFVLKSLRRTKAISYRNRREKNEKKSNMIRSN